MAEDEETASARYIAGNISTQLMLKTLFEIISTMADDQGPWPRRQLPRRIAPCFRFTRIPEHGGWLLCAAGRMTTIFFHIIHLVARRLRTEFDLEG
jgi:hypothetical protein